MATRKKRRHAEPSFVAEKKRVPFDFVLDELESLAPHTKPMFGCTAVYVGERIVFILRERDDERADNGVWIATTREHHASLRTELPSLRSIGVLTGGTGETGWQLIPAEALDFEESVFRAAELVRRSDPRIGKVPKRRAPRSRRS